MSGAQTSAFPDQNILYNNASGLTTAHVLQNQLMNQEAQQTINANEMEQISRASNWVISQDPENKDPAKQAAAYGAAVKLLRANNFAKNAPEQYPGFDAMQMMARQGTPSKDLYQQTQDSAWANANKIGGGGAPGATAPPADGGGGFSSDKETARKQIVARESGGDPTALNYVARQDPTAYARGATASGKYQFVNSTWREGLQLAGLDPAKYATARDAPEAVQDQVFDAVYAKYGTKPWQQGPKDWVKDEAGNYQLATVRPPPGSPGGAPVTAAAAPPGGGVAARYPGAVQAAGPAVGTAPAASPGAAAAPPAPVTTIEPETGLPMLSAPPNQVMPGQPNGPPARPAVPMRETFVRGPDGSVQKALVPVDGSGPPVIVPPPTAPAAPAATAPAASAPPPPAINLPPIPPPTPVNPATRLTTAQEQELNGLLPLASRSREGQAAWVARKQSMIEHNDAEQRQYATDVAARQDKVQAQQERAVADARAAATQQREEAAAAALAEQRRVENQRAVETQRREEAARAEAAAKADEYTLQGGDDGSRKYAAAYSRVAAPKVNVDGSKVYPVMTAYDKPTWSGGKGQVAEGGAAPDYAAQTVTPPTQMNATEQRVGSFADAMLRSNPTINQTEEAASNWAERAGARVGDYVGFNVNSPEFQQYRTAKENFINAIARPESGAVVNPDEYVRYDRMYFPQPGESAATVKLKREFREDKIQETIRQAGPAYKAPTGASYSQSAPKPPDKPRPAGFDQKVN